MDIETQKRFEEFDERLRLAEKRILATGNLVSKVGIPSLVETQIRLDALIDSDTRLYGALAQLAERMDQSTVRMDQLTDRMDQSTVRMDQLTLKIDQLAEMQQETERRLQAFLNSMTKGNGR